MTSNGVTTSFAYDAWGRMASKNATIGGTPYGAAYQYSYGDKLKHVWTNFPGETTTAYNYDGLGKRRVRITDYNGVNPETTWWRWDLGWTPLCEYDDPNLDWEIEGFAQFNVYNGLMHPLAEAAVSGSPANAAYSFLALDHLSSTRAVYNQAKTATASLEFYPYGETFAATGTLPDARFTAKSYDPETGLYYFPYRYYSPAASRWISRDPLGMIDGPNVYGYVRGNPIYHNDPFGKFVISIILAPVFVIALQLVCGIWAHNTTENIENDKERHCVVACLTNKCSGLSATASTAIAAIIWEFLGGWQGQESIDDIIASLIGIGNSHKLCSSCAESCKKSLNP